MKNSVNILLLALNIMMISCAGEVKKEPFSEISDDKESSIKNNEAPKKEVQNSSLETIEIGSAYQGGIVFHLNSDGQSGLIAAKEDLLTIYEENFFQNHPEIKDAYSAYKWACDNYVSGGYTDWRMPTPVELEKLYNQRKVVPNLHLKYGCCNPPPAFYISSDPNFWMGFASGSKNYGDTGVQFGGGRVRPVRTF